VLDATDYSRYY